MVQSRPLILTLKLDPATFEHANSLRKQHFPPERNVIPAHVTLFHKLPNEHEKLISQHLQEFCSQLSPLPLQLSTVRFLGRGVAITVHCPELLHLRQTLAERWSGWLSPQDQQGYTPHITVQNKVSPLEAQDLYKTLKQEWQPQDGYGEGVLLWHYCGGPWELANDFLFSYSSGGDR